MKQKSLLMLIVACIAMSGCGNANAKKKYVQPHENGVEVLYFHGKQRCATCVAIEKNTRQVVESEFPEELQNGELIFHIVDITKPQNKDLADKYEITWSSLVVVKYEDGKEQVENLTNFAFANARNNPDTFRRELTDKLKKLLE